MFSDRGAPQAILRKYGCQARETSLGDSCTRQRFPLTIGSAPSYDGLR